MRAQKAKLKILKRKGQRLDCGVPFKWSNGITEFFFNVDVWDFDVHVLVNCDGNQLKEYLDHCSKGVHFLGKAPEGTGACTCITGPYGTKAIISLHWPWDGTPYQISVLAHEILHAVCILTKHYGLTLHHTSEEAFTYTQDYILKTCLEILGYKEQKPKPFKWSLLSSRKKRHP